MNEIRRMKKSCELRDEMNEKEETGHRAGNEASTILRRWRYTLRRQFGEFGNM